MFQINEGTYDGVQCIGHLYMIIPGEMSVHLHGNKYLNIQDGSSHSLFPHWCNLNKCFIFSKADMSFTFMIPPPKRLCFPLMSLNLLGPPPLP